MPGKVFLVACLLAGLGLAAANDIPIKFCAKNCTGAAMRDLHVQLSGCTDRPFSCKTGDDGCCSIDKAPEVVQYCSGSAGNFCQWTVISSSLNLAPDVTTLTRNGMPVIARDYSCCKCAGGGEICPNMIFDDAATKSCPSGLAGISTNSSSGYFTVNFKPVDCCLAPPPPTCANYSCPGTSSLREPLPDLSGGLLRNDTNCCKVPPPPTCADYYCPGYSRRKAPLPDLSGGLLVSETNCCDPPTCASYSCPFNSSVSPPPSGLGLVPSEDYCCIPTCAGYQCNYGSLKSPPPAGVGLIRSHDVCCDPPTCAGYSCRFNNSVLPPPSGLGLVVNEAHCCIPTCEGYSCPSGSLRSPPPTGAGLFPIASICCIPPSCDGYTCTSGYLKETLPTPAFTLVRNDDTCCDLVRPKRKVLRRFG